jgi:CheY-like chemotaxis protein
VHILLVEDDDRVAAALRPALHRHGMTTTRLSRGRGVTEHLAGVDVVLLDLGLPDIDGWEALRRLRAEPRGGTLRVVAFTAHAMVGDRERALAAGFDGYLSKPIDFATFAASVGGLLS